MATPECYEPESVAALREWYAEMFRSAYACGPLLPPKSNHKEDNSEKGVAIEEFMNTVLRTHGAKSLVYVSSRHDAQVGLECLV